MLSYLQCQLLTCVARLLLLLLLLLLLVPFRGGIRAGRSIWDVVVSAAAAGGAGPRCHMCG